MVAVACHGRRSLQPTRTIAHQHPNRISSHQDTRCRTRSRFHTESHARALHRPNRAARMQLSQSGELRCNVVRHGASQCNMLQDCTTWRGALAAAAFIHGSPAPADCLVCARMLGAAAARSADEGDVGARQAHPCALRVAIWKAGRARQHDNAASG